MNDLANGHYPIISLMSGDQFKPLCKIMRLKFDILDPIPI